MVEPTLAAPDDVASTVKSAVAQCKSLAAKF